MSDNIFDNLDLGYPNPNHINPSEFEQYLSKPVENVNDPIAWWVAQSTRFPCLSRMALDYLTIPGLSLPLFTHCLSVTNCLHVKLRQRMSNVFSPGVALFCLTSATA